MQDLKVSVAEILGRPGDYRDVTVSHPLPGVRAALARLSDGAALRGRLRTESVVEGVLVSGAVRGDTTLECARCLREFESELELDVCELFIGPGGERDEAEDFYEVTGLEIDLEPMLRDAVALGLPLRPLCREDCKGICARCGQDLNERQCVCSDEVVDERWAALSDLKKQLES